MRNRDSKFLRIFLVVIVAFTVSSGVLFQRRWKARSQGGMGTVTIYMYPTYQFNTLNGPTGLLLLHPSNPDQGVGYFHLFIADTGNHVIRQFTSTTGSLNTIAGTIGTPGYADGANALLNFPTGLSGNSTVWHECTGVHRDTCTYYDYENIYINDSQNYVVRKVCAGSPNPSNPSDCNVDVQTYLHPVQTVSGTAVAGYTDGPNSSAPFGSLAGYTAGSPNYLADAGNHTIRAWDGVTVSTFAGSGSYGYVNVTSPEAISKYPDARTNARWQVTAGPTRAPACAQGLSLDDIPPDGLIFKFICLVHHT